MVFQRKAITDQLKKHLAFKAHLLQILIGPRRVGKTTLIQRFFESWDSPHLYMAADNFTPPGVEFILENWKRGRAFTDVEVDFIVRRGEQLLAVEVKSGAVGRRSGLNIFAKRYPGTQKILIGSDGDISLEDFFEKGLPG